MYQSIKNLLGIKKKKLKNVFTPSSAAQINYLKRESLEEILDDNIDIIGKQIIVFGHSGSGKTTLVRNAISRVNKNFIITSCTSDTTFNDVIIKSFEKLNPYYLSKTTKKELVKITAELKNIFNGIESKLKGEVGLENSDEYQRALPMQLTYERLAEFLDAANCIWIIDDFHKVADEEKKKLADVMKAFSDLSNDYPEVKIIALGAVDSPREIVNNTKDINRRLAEIEVPLLTPDEIKEIIINGATLLNIQFSETLVTKTIYHSNSLASICHQLCRQYCKISKIDKTCNFKKTINKDILDKAIIEFNKSKSDTYKEIFDKAIKRNENSLANVEIILSAIIKLDRDKVSHGEILAQIKKEKEDYPQGNLTSYLKKLCSVSLEEILRLDTSSGKYFFSDPFFEAYCKSNLNR